MPVLNKVRVNNTDYDLIGQENYSTTEQVIGTWVDGKPLYRQVFEISSYAANTLNKIWIGTGKNITKIDGVLYDAYGDILPLTYINIFGASSVVNGVAVVFDTTEQKYYIGLRSYGDSGIQNGFVVLEYTKTTD